MIFFDLITWSSKMGIKISIIGSKMAKAIGPRIKAFGQFLRRHWAATAAVILALLITGTIIGLIVTFPISVLVIASIPIFVTPLAFLASIPFPAAVVLIAGICLLANLFVSAAFNALVHVHNFINEWFSSPVDDRSNKPRLHINTTERVDKSISVFYEDERDDASEFDALITEAGREGDNKNPLGSSVVNQPSPTRISASASIPRQAVSPAVLTPSITVSPAIPTQVVPPLTPPSRDFPSQSAELTKAVKRPSEKKSPKRRESNQETSLGYGKQFGTLTRKVKRTEQPFASLPVKKKICTNPFKGGISTAYIVETRNRSKSLESGLLERSTTRKH
jgi:hypothetical protein